MSSQRPLNERLEILLDEFEEQCAQAEVALRGRQWQSLEQFIADQRRTRQAIVNELAAENAVVQTMPEVFSRLQAIFTLRNDQIRRLNSYRTEVSRRLQITRKWKDATRSARRGMGPSPVLFSKTQ